MEETWQGYRLAQEEDLSSSIDTGVEAKVIKALAKQINTLPAGEKIFSKTAKVFSDRLKMIEDDQLDWGMCEMLAYASLLKENHPVRLSGQDVERGTFSHRHAVVKTDEDGEKEIVLLNEVNPNLKFNVYNSLLSEYGVLGFDYGYAFATPNGLTIWEAQFGDFNNGAQIIIDQFISAAEDKWRTMNGITLLLPHGYEGQGSEHSSARMERYLQLCAENNMYVCDVTTPANFFHLLRRQVKNEFRKPLVVFTPKKLLRYPKAVSSMKELTKGGFQEVLDDVSIAKKQVDTVVLCTGKVYYEAMEMREKLGADAMALVRLEQLYPLPTAQIEKLLKTYPKGVKLVWLQEEPENMGAWSYILRSLKHLDLDVVALPASASPATGSSKMHEKRMTQLFQTLFATTTQKA
jgi:2-oxoglutarate dehydrogenase E1 component